MLDEQVALLPARVVLTCESCGEVTEVAADEPRMPEHCHCGGWTWTGELAEPARAS